MDLIPDLKHIHKHLPDTTQMQWEIRQHGDTHVFLSREMMEYVTQEILQRGQFTGLVRGFERFGLEFDHIIGYRIDAENRQIPLYYGGMKIRGGKYHVIPRVRPSQ